jgi:hypothetical protein
MKNTPWGIPDTINKIIEGLYFVSTPSHGGYMVEKSLAKKLLPATSIDSGFLGQAWGNYYCYEEDCAYAVLEYFILCRNPVDETRKALEAFLEKNIFEYLNVIKYKDRVKNTVFRWYPAELNADY